MSYQTPDGRPHQVRLCAQDTAKPTVGQEVQIRYTADRPNDDVAPATEDRVTPIVPIPAALLAVGLVFRLRHACSPSFAPRIPCGRSESACGVAVASTGQARSAPTV